MRERSLFVPVSAICALAWLSSPCLAGDEAAAAVSAPRAEVSTIGFVTHDLAATVAFYTEVLGFKLAGTADVTAEKTRQVIGAKSAGAVSYAALAPQAWIDGDRSLALVSFFEILDAPDGGLT